MKRPPHDAQKDRTTVTGSEAPITLIKCASQRDDSCCPLLKPHLFSSAFIHACWRSVRAALEEFTATKPSPNGTPAHSPSLHLPIAVLPYAYNQYPPPSPHTHTQKSPRVKQNCPPQWTSISTSALSKNHLPPTVNNDITAQGSEAAPQQPSAITDQTKQQDCAKMKPRHQTRQQGGEVKQRQEREQDTGGGGIKCPLWSCQKVTKKENYYVWHLSR